MKYICVVHCTAWGRRWYIGDVIDVKDGVDIPTSKRFGPYFEPLDPVEAVQPQVIIAPATASPKETKEADEDAEAPKADAAPKIESKKVETEAPKRPGRKPVKGATK